ncbi:MAG TPA: tetratricopeptide repeat protein, partial [Polyangiaceae bacterium]|nr:tetratricopeptide repeat protein [Polyangiaceae bacterium]
RGQFEPDEHERRAVDSIVARLEHIPLAVELAAARARALSIDEILERLAANLELLDHGPRDRTARQTTMHGAIRWSWDLLDEHERIALARLSVCGHGFDFDSATALLQEARMVEALRDKSLLRSHQEIDGTTRFTMLESIRAFAADRLEEMGEADTTRARFAEHLLSTAERALEPSEAVLRRIGRDRVHYERLMRTAPPLTAIRAAVVLDALAPDEGLAVRELVHLEAALQHELPDRWIARALTVRAALRTFTADFPGALEDCAQAAGLARDDVEVTAWARYRLGYVLASSGHLEDALASYASAIGCFQTLDQQAGVARALQQQAACLQSINRPAEALALFERCRALSRTRGYQRIELRAEAGLGFHYLEAGHFDESMRHYQRCLELAREVGAGRTHTLVTGYVGLLCFDHDQDIEALEHTTAAAAAAREAGDTRIEGLFLAEKGAVHAARDEIEEAEAAFDRSDVLLEPNPFSAAICSIFRGHLELARARSAAARGDLDAWRRLRSQAARRIEDASVAREGGRLVDRSDDARIAVRILERALGRTTAPNTSTSDPRAVELVLLEQGFRIDDGPSVDLSRRATLRALFHALCEQHERDPGGAVSAAELVEAAWPGERMARSSALNRLHVALASLRALGLRAAIERVAEGYRILPRVRVQRIKP